MGGKLNQKTAAILAFIFTFCVFFSFSAYADYTEPVLVFQEVTTPSFEYRTVQELSKEAIHISPEKPKEKTPLEKALEQYSMDDIYMIARICVSEAEGEPELGKRLVIDTILNRVDHEKFPNNVMGVVFQKGQYTCTTNGRLDRCDVREDFVELVIDEMNNRTNSDVIFFRTTRYSDYGNPLFRVCCHYFSGLD